MIQHHPDIDSFLDSALFAQYEEQLQEIDSAARQSDQRQVGLLERDGREIMDEDQVIKNQVAHFIRRLKNWAEVKGVQE